ncbi:hypothetical protein P4S72_26695 [Vibrio sp. PP-XX7]
MKYGTLSALYLNDGLWFCRQQRPSRQSNWIKHRSALIKSTADWTMSFSRLARYNLARTQYYLGDSGAVVAAEHWYAAHLEWLNSMDALRRSLSDYKTLAQSDAGTFKSRIATLMQGLSDSISESRQIRTLADKGIDLLVNIPSYPENYIDEMTPIIPALNTNVSTAYTAFVSINTDFSVDKMQRLQNDLLMTKEVLESLITRSKLQFPELTASLNNLQQLFAVDSLVDVPVSNASKSAAFIQIQSKINWFLADAEFTKFAAQYQSDREKIMASGLDSSLTQSSLDSMEQRYTEAKHHLETSQGRAYSHLYSLYRKHSPTMQPSASMKPIIKLIIVLC